MIGFDANRPCGAAATGVGKRQRLTRKSDWPFPHELNGTGSGRLRLEIIAVDEGFCAGVPAVLLSLPNRRCEYSTTMRSAAITNVGA